MLIRCLGPVALQHDDGATHLTKSERHIVALLAVAGPDGLTTDRLADELYGDELTAGWEGSIRQHIRRLRKKIGLQEIALRSGRYMLDVPATEVDLWTLFAVDELDLTTLSQDLLLELLGGEPFSGVELSPLLQASEESIATTRARLLTRMAEPGYDWSPQTLLGARTLVARSDYREDLLIAVLDLHLSGNHIRGHELAIKASHAIINEARLRISPALQARIDKIAAVANDPTRAIATTDEPRSPGVAGRVVGVFADGTGTAMIARPPLQTAIENQLAETAVLATGESGSGKSALVQSLVPRLAASGHHVLWLSGRRGSTAAYQPFLAALPSVESALAPLMDDGGNELLRMKCWGAIRRRLSTQFADLPLILIVDDAQWLDSHSQALLTYLCSTQDDTAPTLLAIGREDPMARDWTRFCNELRTLGIVTIDVPAFDRDELLDLIRIYHQASTSKQRHDFVATLVHIRADLPLVAHELIRSADPDTLALAGDGANHRASGFWVERIADPARQIAATAAAAGQRFRLATISALTEFDTDTILDASEELTQAGLWVSEQRLDEFSFRHILIHADFEAVLKKADRARLHLRLGEEASERSDIHACAAHLLEAGVLAGTDRVRDALLASARQFHRNGSYREAVNNFTNAHRLADHQLDVLDLLHFSSAVSRSGGDGWELRATAFEQALRAGDASQCLDVALHEALATENVMGQQRRVDMLERVPVHELTDARRAEHAAALARELGLLGLHKLAVETAIDAMDQFTEPDDRFTAWLGSWASCRSLPPDMWPKLPEDRKMVSRPELVSRLAQVEFGLAFVRGDDIAARHYLAEFASDPATESDPVRSWHRGLAETTLCFVDGRWDDARQIADRTFGTASERGVVAAFSTRLAQEFVLQWVLGQHGALLRQFGDAAPDIHDTQLAQAAFATILAEHDDHQSAARERIAQIARQSLDHQSPLSAATAALLASTPSELRSIDTNEILKHILQPFLGSALIPGAALSHLGPASWSLARLAAQPDDEIALMRQACDEAEQWNLKLWSVICLRDLAALTNDDGIEAAARHKAAGTQLEVLL